MKQIHIGEAIRQRRVELGLTQEELCFGICEAPTLSRIETGKKTPTPTKLKALLQRLGLPSEKYYAMLSENELEIEQLKDEIIDCNTRKLYKDGLQKIDSLSKIVEPDDHLTQQFIMRSKVLLGKMEQDEVVSYTSEEKLDLLLSAIKLTIPNFDIDEIGAHWYSLEEMKIINQISAVYDNNNQQQIAIDIYYQLMKYIRKKLVVNADNITTVILIAYNYSLTLCREKRYNEAINIANWGRQKSIEWGRASSLGGLFYILGESFYHTGNIQKSKDQFMQAYYAFLIMDNRENSNLMKEYLLDYFDVQV